MIAKKVKIKKKKKKKFRKVSSLIFWGIGLIALAGFLIFSGLRVKEKRDEMSNEIETLKEEIRLLEERNNQLEEGLSQAESDFFWDAKLYEQGYKKPGEEVVVVVPPEERQEPAPEEEKNFWDNLWQKIKSFGE